MKTIWILAIALFLSVSLPAQQKINYKKTPSGIEYAIIKKGKGEKVRKTERIYINYTTRIKPDSIFDSNSSTGKPYAFILGQEEVLPGWDEGIALLSIGDSAHFRIPPALTYGQKKIGSIPPNTTLLLEVKVLKAEQAFYNLAGKDTISFPNGLKKILINIGTGEAAKPFYNVTLQFTGYVLNQKGYKRVFQSSLTNSTVAIFQLGAGRMVKGLDQGIATMKTGEKSTFIVPPALGFGKEVSGIIPGNSTLYFDIELLGSIDPFFHTTSKDTILTNTGITIVPVLKQEGTNITVEEIVSFDYTGYFIDTMGHPIIFDNTLERKTPAFLRPGAKGAFPGLGEGLIHLKKGEKAIVYVPSKLAFGDKGKGIIPPNKALIYDIHILETKTYPFFEVKGLDTVKNTSGLQYLKVRKTEGAAVVKGSKVAIAYTGFVIDSLGYRRIFDASRENKKMLEFTLGKGEVIPGFDEGVLGMTIGEGRRLIIPYSLGYGEKGIPEVGIPPKTTIYFDVELVEIKN